MKKFYTFSVVAILVIAAVLGFSIVRQSRIERDRKMLEQFNAVGEFYEKYDFENLVKADDYNADAYMLRGLSYQCS